MKNKQNEQQLLPQKPQTKQQRILDLMWRLSRLMQHPDPSIRKRAEAVNKKYNLL